MEKKNYKYISLIPFMAVLLFSFRSQAAEKIEISIIGDNRNVPLKVELADTAEKRSKGLMFRDHLPADTGMLFDFKTARPIYMWMKNTEISLDMMFADADGVIFQLHKGAKPHDLTVISSFKPGRWVLEVNAGFISQKSVKIGDRLKFTQD